MKKNNFGFLIALAIIVVFSVWFNWFKPEKHEVTLSIEREMNIPEYGDWYREGTLLGETRVHDIYGKYIGSVLNDPEMSTKYYWWVPRSSMSFENALDNIAVDAVWKDDKFIDMFGTDFLVGCETL